MITVYNTEEGRLREREEITPGAWVDLCAPTEEEILRVSTQLELDPAAIRAALDEEERSRIEAEDDYLLVLVDTPCVEEQSKRGFVYTTLPFGIILTQDNIITVCLKESALARAFTDSPVKNFSTRKKNRMTLQMLYRNATLFLFYLRELEAAEGYTLDKEYKTVNVQAGKTVHIEWENTAVTGQIQIYKYAAEYNEVTGAAPGTPLEGAVYEIVHERSGKVVDYITTDVRGVAASKPLPLGRYKIVEVTAPAYWQVDATVHDVTLEFPGQIIKLSAYDKPSSLGVTLTKRGNAEVLAGNQMRYDITVANTSNVPLENFYWHDRIPTDVSRATVLTTGTYSARLNYRILYKTNYSASYQVLASNLLTSNSYSFALNAIPTQAGEVVTDVFFDFGKVPVGFQSVTGPTLTVVINGDAVNGYQLVNRADAGGKYQGTWQTAHASWVTIIKRLGDVPALPKTGY